VAGETYPREKKVSTYHAFGINFFLGIATKPRLNTRGQKNRVSLVQCGLFQASLLTTTTYLVIGNSRTNKVKGGFWSQPW
jgi:hypothetical protein